MQPAPQSPSRVLDVVKRGLSVYVATLSMVFIVALVMAIIGAAPSIARLLNGKPLQPETFSVAVLLIDILILVVNGLLTCVIFHRMYGLMQAKITSISQSLHYVLNRSHIIIPVIVLVWFAVMLGGMLLLIPGLFLAVLLCMAYPCVLFENAGIFGALERSAVLVWGNWWRTFFVLLIPMLVVLPALISGTVLITAGYNPWMGIGVTVLFIALVTPLYAAVLLAQYDDLTVRETARPKASE